MGGCFSSSDADHSSTKAPPAIVVSPNGEVRQYSAPVTVSLVLISCSSPPDHADSGSLFVCNSDRLNFDENVPSLDPKDQLEVSQIYFVLPKTMLHRPLAAVDMADLAVKASAALEKIKRPRRRNYMRKSRKISPVLVEEGPQLSSNCCYESEDSPRVSRCSSMRKLQRYSSRRAKIAVRSFRLRLNTIYEGSVLQEP